MKCTKCNHTLPDDSEFCQYCGTRIEKTIAPPIEAKPEPIVEEVPAVLTEEIGIELPVTEIPEQAQPVVETSDPEPIVEEPKPLAPQLPDFGNMTPDEALTAILQIQAKNTVDAMEANSQTQPVNEADADFGLVPEKPIFTLALKSVEGEKEYLSRLYTSNGEKIKYNRRGSMSANGINGMIDIYDTYLPSGQPYKTIYINMYGAKCSMRAPAGFSFEGIKNTTCPKCNHALPKDSEFCQFCGSRISTKPVAPQATIPAAPIAKPSPKVVTTDSRPHQSVPEKTTPQKKNQKKWKIASIILIVLVVISLAANVAQFFYRDYSTADIQAQLDAANKTIAEKDASITSYKNTISSQTTTINRQKTEISNLKTKSGYFDDIVSGMRYGNAGYAASNFFSNDSVIVVSKSNSSYKFTLTANWSNGGTVEVDYSSSCAYVSFDKDEWYTSTKMTVHPRSKGVTVATFSNSVNSQTFKVLIIVTD